MDLKQLEVFRNVCEERSFSKAAIRLGLTQPTISGHVKTLEQFFGCQLLDRLGRKTVPTRAGELLYRQCLKMFDLKRVIVDRMGRFLDKLEGELHAVASTIPGEYLLPPFVGRFHKTYPGIRIRLEISDSRAVCQSVKEGRHELGFVGARVPERDLEFRRLATDKLMPVIAPVGSWSSVREASLGSLKREPLVIRQPGSGTRMIMERHLNEQGYSLEEFNVVAELGSTAAIKEAIKTGVGWSIISNLAIRSETAAGLLRPIRVSGIRSMERSFFVVVNTRRNPSPICETFLDLLSLELPVPASQEEKPVAAIACQPRL